MNTPENEYIKLNHRPAYYEEIIKSLDQYIVGQAHAKKIVAEYLCNTLSQLYTKEGPLGIFFLKGPTGVGKTLLAEELARVLFGTKDALLKIEGEQFTQSHEGSQLFGAPAGYIGYDHKAKFDPDKIYKPYREAIQKNTLHPLLKRHTNAGIILIDEVEKIHMKVKQSLLNLLGSGSITLKNNKKIDISNFLVFMTSNVGEHQASSINPIGYTTTPSDHAQSIKEKELRKIFSPEFISRVDEFIEFEPLTLETKKQLVQLLQNELQEDLKIMCSGLITYSLSENFITYLEEQVKAKEGMRKLRKTREKLVQGPLGSAISLNELDQKKKRFELLLDLDGDEVVVLCKMLGDAEFKKKRRRRKHNFGKEENHIIFTKQVLGDMVQALQEKKSSQQQ